MTVAPQSPDPLDEQRRAAQARLEAAVGEGRLTLDEFTDRVERVWAAGERAELERTLADLPVPVVGQTPVAQSTLFNVIGDIRRSGRWSLRGRTIAVRLIGDVDLDLRGALVGGDDEITIDVYGLIGDAVLTVPEGIEVELTGITLLGDRKVQLAAVPRVPGTPVVRLRVFTLIGDVKVRSAR
jgi:Domain of unknown function (DUF1707)/Cell wall-active antibiotics response 4TMS YvqF